MKILFALAVVAASSAAVAQVAPKPLFNSDAPIRFTIQGPVNSIARKAAKSVEPEAATLSLTTPAETHPIRLSARGLSRRTGGICDFPPLRVEFTQPPAAASLFAGQRRLKLVTHCKSSAGHQQHVLMEYSAYLLLNQLTPLSHRVRLATVDYADAKGKPIISRYGFFIEDLDDVARRNGLNEAQVPDRINASQLDPSYAARTALFMYMIGNLDWSMRAGPQGEGCCHNSRLLSGGPALVPVAYDFDYSGLVDAPYAIPPAQIRVRSVRQRHYMGYCRHNTQVLAAAAEMRAKRPALEAVYSQVPGLEDRTRRKALAYLAGFFEDIATDQAVGSNILKNCVGG
ncbi:MAG: hypothetical protein M3Q19_10950 [Pseudomonadota bacterium]|nr:hypothetical protein [Pseudomonadota bacterium]